MIKILRKSWQRVVAVTLAVVVLAIPAIAGVAVAITTEKDIVAEVSFRQGVAIDKVLSEARASGLQVVGLYSTYVIGSQPPFTDFQKVQSSDNTSTITKKFLDNRNTLINFHLKSCERILNEKLCTTEGAALLEQVKRDLALAVQDQTEGSSEKGIMTITGVMVRGPQHSVSMLTQRLPVENIRLIPLNEKDDPSLKQSSTSYAVTATAETWVPEEGTCLTGQYSDTRRTVCQWLRWDDKSGFTSNSTYEHDFFTYYYDGKAYLDPTDSWPGQFPWVDYWSSNLPDPYLDTRLGDPDGEKAYTIGSASAVNISTNSWYSSSIITSNGNSSSDTGKLVAQLGHRYPSSCKSVWCSFGDDWEFIVPAWQISLPGEKTWRY
ncbi:MAG TPA: hypothetical protein GXX19_13710 [Syntrophomonadaceae bacterium]|nr:hypothetical protein [Syntrophomonadaceae bacterium]